MGRVSISGGGGVKAGSDECTATSSEVLKGYTAITSDSDDKVVEGTLELTGDVADSQVLTGKTYYSKEVKVKRTGTMPNRGVVSAALNAGESYIIPAGYHNGSGKVTSNSLASQTPGNASAGHILSGQTAWVNGNKVTGSIPYQNAEISGTDHMWAQNYANWGDGNYFLGVRNEHYLNGVNWVRGYNANFVASNIKKGVNIGGVVGTFEGWIGVDTDLYYNGNNKAGFTLTTEGTYSSGSLETGMIWLKFGGNYNLYLRSSMSYNLSLYSKINFYFMAETGWSSGYVFRLEDYPDITTTITNITAGGYYTATLNIAGLNATILPKILMWAWGSGTSGANRCRIYLYRIYLS